MLLDDMVTLLVNAGVGVANSTIFYGSQVQIPTGAGPFVTLTEYGGMAPERTQNKISPPAYRRPSFQVTVRAQTLVAARAKALAAHNALNVRNTTVGGTWYKEISPIQEPFDLGQQDDNGRVRYVFNVNVVHGT